MRNAFVRSLTELAAADSSVVLLTADLGFGCFDDFEKRFPEQFINVGIAEQNLIGIASGLAMSGYKVFVYSIGNFPTLRCLEQIRNDACYHELNVNIVASGGGFTYGMLGMSHHATEDIAIMRALPKVTVVAPGTDWETRQATLALAELPGVGYLRIEKNGIKDPGSINNDFEIGKARVLRDGKDVALVSTGGILAESFKAADELLIHGISCKIISMHTVKPLDCGAIIAVAKNFDIVMSIEEGNLSGGFGSAIAEAYLDAGITPHFFYRFGMRDKYSSIVGDQAYLRNHYGMDAGAIVDRVMKTRRHVQLAFGSKLDEQFPKING
ncbi:MAG TPA: transketolase [Gammaproteobacteria bacterium]|nr:transketolase [Gammaproteobacteria bacterium]